MIQVVPISGNNTKEKSFISSSEKHKVTQLYIFCESKSEWMDDTFRAFSFTGTTAKTAAREVCPTTKPTMQQQVRNPEYKHTPEFVFIILQMVLNTLFWHFAVAQGTDCN